MNLPDEELVGVRNPASVTKQRNISSKEFFTLPVPRSISNMDKASSDIVGNQPIFGTHRRS